MLGCWRSAVRSRRLSRLLAILRDGRSGGVVADLHLSRVQNSPRGLVVPRHPADPAAGPERNDVRPRHFVRLRRRTVRDDARPRHLLSEPPPQR